jgi:hypothetical protein
MTLFFFITHDALEGSGRTNIRKLAQGLRRDGPQNHQVKVCLGQHFLANLMAEVSPLHVGQNMPFREATLH